MHVSTTKHLNCDGQESKEQLAVYNSDTPVTLKQGHGHQTQYELVDLKQGYNMKSVKKPRLNSVREKPTIIFCDTRKRVSYFP